MKITIADVARKAGVSKSTVSRILNGNYEQNTQRTIDKVLKVIEEMDFQPNALAKGLKSNKTNIIGIVLSNLKNPFWASVLEGVEDECRSSGFNLMICNSNENPSVERDHIKSFQLKQVEGIIINTTLGNEDIYKDFSEKNFPFVTINRKIPNTDVNGVFMDNIEGAKIAVQHFIDNGLREIAIFIYPTKGVSPREERLEGYRRALQDNSLVVKEELIKIVGENKEIVKKEVKNLLSSHQKVEAIFSTNNILTLYVMEAIRELGLKVPQDIALIGYDETVWSMHLNPPLTTVYQPAYKMGELAAKKVIELINNKEQKIPTEQISLLPNLIVRQSSIQRSQLNE